MHEESNQIWQKSIRKRSTIGSRGEGGDNFLSWGCHLESIRLHRAGNKWFLFAQNRKKLHITVGTLENKNIFFYQNITNSPVHWYVMANMKQWIWCIASYFILFSANSKKYKIIGFMTGLLLQRFYRYRQKNTKTN